MKKCKNKGVDLDPQECEGKRRNRGFNNTTNAGIYLPKRKDDSFLQMLLQKKKLVATGGRREA